MSNINENWKQKHCQQQQKSSGTENGCEGRGTSWQDSYERVRNGTGWRGDEREGWYQRMIMKSLMVGWSHKGWDDDEGYEWIQSGQHNYHESIKNGLRTKYRNSPEICLEWISKTTIWLILYSRCYSRDLSLGTKARDWIFYRFTQLLSTNPDRLP